MEIILEEDVEVDDMFTKALINGVISDGITASDDEDKTNNSNRKRVKKKGINGVIGKVSKSGKRPDFELADIMGRFDIDDAGNYIILRGELGKLYDKEGKEVNRRGYLIDRLGSIINRKNELIF